MKLIVITGPSGSGKTYLAYKLAKHFKQSLVISTDSYYRDNIFIKILSKFIDSIYDRIISIKKRKLIETIKSISDKGKYINFHYYDFKRKKSTKERKKIEKKKDNILIILEGIFAHRLDLNYKETINIICNDNKEICYQRRINRDQLERGEDIKEIIKKFDKSWILYNKHIKKYINYNHVYKVDPLDKTSFQKLILKLSNEIVNKKKTKEIFS